MIKSDKRKKVYKFSYVSIWKIDIQICIWMTQDMQDRSGFNFSSVNGIMFDYRNKIKGQLVSKCVYGTFNSCKKFNFYHYGTSSRIVSFHFLGELKTPKRHYKINLPLGQK